MQKDALTSLKISGIAFAIAVSSLVLSGVSGWGPCGPSIVFSDAGDSDSPYFFYSRNPVTGAAPWAVWAGGATIFETSEIAEWVKQNAPGIPQRLAECFAWHVMLDPQQ